MALSSVYQTLGRNDERSSEIDYGVVVPEGPFGGGGGEPFYDGVGDIVQITITYSSEVVWSVQADYGQRSADVFSAAIHGSRGPQEDTIELDFSDGERLIQVKGTFAPAGGVATDVVTSLTFITTKKTYGPYGAEVGQEFQSFPQAILVGFFGRSGNYIDAFGTFTKFSRPIPDLIPDGPWGGNGGSAFHDAPAENIPKIVVGYNKNRYITSLTLTYDRGSKGFETVKHGGDGDSEAPIEFDYDEHLDQVTGTFGWAGDWTAVTSLSLITNKRGYGPFGNVSGDEFESRPNARIFSFFGRSGVAIDQLGVLVGKPLTLEVARFGGNGGGAFYEGRGEIYKIEVTFFKGQAVAGLKVTYLQGGEEFEGAKHGTDGNDDATITLNSPDEYLVQVTGTHGSGSGVKDLILSIQFITNQKTYGPYGDPDSGKPFGSPKALKILGLFGRSGNLIDQIGVISLVDTSAGNQPPVAA